MDRLSVHREDCTDTPSLDTTWLGRPILWISSLSTLSSPETRWQQRVARKEGVGVFTGETTGHTAVMSPTAKPLWSYQANELVVAICVTATYSYISGEKWFFSLMMLRWHMSQ